MKKIKISEILIVCGVALGIGGLIYAMIGRDADAEDANSPISELGENSNLNHAGIQNANDSEFVIAIPDNQDVEGYNQEVDYYFEEYSNYGEDQLPPYPQDSRPMREIQRDNDTSSQDYLLFQEARDYLDDGFNDDAIRTFRAFIRAYPDSIYRDLAEIHLGQALVERGKVTDNRQDFVRAREILISALQRFRQNAGLYDNESVEQLSMFLVAIAEANRNFGIPNNEIENAIENLLIYAEGPIKEELYTQLGYLKFYNDDFDEAMRSFQQSDTILAKLGRARVYVEQDNRDYALTIYREIIDYHADSRYFPEVLRTYYVQSVALGKQYYQRGEYQRAIDILKRVIELNSDNSYAEESYYYLGLSEFQRENYSQAITYFNAGINNDASSRDPDCLFYKCRSVYQDGDLIRALNLFNHFIDYYPTSPHINEANHWKEFITRELETRVEIESNISEPVIPR